MRIKHLFAFAVLCFLIFYNCGCKKVENNGNKIVLATTLLPYADFIKNIITDDFIVETVIPQGGNHETYEPTAFRIQNISKSELYFKVGANFDFEAAWIEKLQNINLNMKVIDCSQNIELINNNPHIWLDPQNVKIILDNILKALIETYPEHADEFKKNASSYSIKLDSLDNRILQQLDNFTNKYLMVYHPAWKYFAKRYNLIEISVENEGKDPSPKELDDLIDIARKNNVKTIFVEPQFDAAPAKTIAKKIRASIKEINPVPENYIDGMLETAKIIKAGL